MLRNFSLSGRVPRDVGAPATPRDAATVMLVRDGAAGPEVFVVRRLRTMAFAAGMLAFPGGAVEEQDSDPDLPWRGEPPAQVSRALVAAAVRETFEECGVLLAPAGSMPDPAVLEELRVRLIEGRARLLDVVRATGSVLDAALLHPWAHWITPEFEARRFDTRFFVARVPPGQAPRDLGGEAEHAMWIGAADAVRGEATGELAMFPPTLVCLEELAASPDVDAVLGTPRRLRPVSPWLDTRPGSDGTPVLQVDLDGVGGGEPR